MYFKGVYCIINATLGLRRDGGRAILVSESGSLSCLVCFHFKLIILSNSLCLHYSLIPLSSLIKRAFIFSLIFIYLFIYYAFRHKTASACVESKLLIFSLSLFFSIIQMIGSLLHSTRVKSGVFALIQLSDDLVLHRKRTAFDCACCGSRTRFIRVQHKQLIYST